MQSCGELDFVLRIEQKRTDVDDKFERVFGFSVQFEQGDLYQAIA